MNLSQLRAIVAVAEVSNFSEAALSLNLTQSTISHSIASLEEELGVPLFLRGRHGATLTPVGERITHYAREVLQLLDRMQQEAQSQRSLKGGQVRIAAFRSVATHVLPAVIAQFHSQFPEVATTLVEGGVHTDIEQLLRDGGADIGFTYLPTSEEFAAWEILRDEYVVLFPPPALTPAAAAPPDTLTWDKLAQLPLILPPEDQPCEIDLYKHFATFAPSLNIAHKINQDSTIVSMVKQGLGVGILPLLAAEPLPSGIRVRSLPIPFERVIGVIILENSLHIPAVFAFLDLLKQIGQLNMAKADQTMVNLPESV
jgi:DNA-binding transcriptional LysR family regulator